MEIVKQLFDIGSLLEPVTDVNIIRQTFNIFAKTEIGYRNCETDENGVLDDIYDTALHICSRGEKGKGNFKALSLGITQMKRFIFSETYHLDRAITDAAKAAYLATVLKYKITKLEKYHGIESIKELVIDQEFDSKLNKLKKSNPEAFFYWYHISLIQLQNNKN
ncbi:MAG: hypothetical protein E2590_07750 [Chryseobacterium sp.]|nr:hypothetical protein [Chryseobacterium sp.]